MSPFSSVVTVSRASAMRSSSRLGSTSRSSLIFAVVTLTGQCSTGRGKSSPRPWLFADGHLDPDEDVRVPELHAGAPIRRLDEGSVDAELPRLIEPAAVDTLPGGGEAVDVSTHQFGDDLLAHQIPSGPKSSSDVTGGSSATGAVGGDSFRMSSRVTE